MKAIKIYTQDSKYFMEDLDTNTTVELTEITKDGISLILPENSANRQFCSIKRADKGTILEYKETKTFGSNTTEIKKAKSKIDLSEYYTDDEKAQIEKLQAKIDKINEAAMERAKKDQTMKALEEQLKNLDPEVLKAMMTRMMGGEA